MHFYVLKLSEPMRGTHRVTQTFCSSCYIYLPPFLLMVNISYETEVYKNFVSRKQGVFILQIKGNLMLNSIYKKIAFLPSLFHDSFNFSVEKSRYLESDLNFISSSMKRYKGTMKKRYIVLNYYHNKLK